MALFSAMISSVRFERASAAASAWSRMTPFTPVRPGPIPMESFSRCWAAMRSSIARRRSVSES